MTTRFNRAGATNRPRPKGRYIHRRKHCPFCVEKVQDIDYKDTSRLYRFLSDRSKIDPRRKTGVCSAHQHELSNAIKRARHIALLPFTRSRSSVG